MTITVTFPTASLVNEQQPAAPATTVIAKAISGDKRIDPLLDDSTYRFNFESAPGTAITVTYSFPDAMPSSYAGDEALDWQPFSEAQRKATREVLSLLQQQTGLTFQELNETPGTSGTMRFSNNTQTNSAGYAYMPNSNQSDKDADTWIASGATTPVVPGSYGWATLVHEIGHAIGLNHPGNYNAGESKSPSAVGNFLSANEDAFFNSIMSYRDSAQDINATWFMPYDMLALRYLYGKKDHGAGDNTYRYDDATGKIVTNVVDDGGTDTFDFSAVTAGVLVNLTPGSYSSAGKVSSGANALANLTTAWDTVIESVIGSGLADTILGNAANNTVTGGAGDDLIDGAGGTDSAVFSGQRASYTLTLSASNARVSGGTDGTDTLIGVERLHFADVKLALDLAGNAGQVAKLLGAVFGPASVANKQYVGIGLSYLDTGMTYEELAALAVSATGTSANNEVVSLLWSNLFGAPPTAEQAAPYVGMLAGGSVSVGALTVMAADLGLNADRINLVGLASTGLEYGS